MMTIHDILGFLRTIRFLKRLGVKEGLGNPFKGLSEERNNSAYILANGPSLSEFLAEFEANPETYKNVDFCALNNFVNDDRFELIKPKYYAISDPLFFYDTQFFERGHKVDEQLASKVCWDMYLFIPYCYNLNNSY